MSKFARQGQDYNEVRYLLRHNQSKGRQKVFKIGDYMGHLIMHLRDYEGFTETKEGWPTDSGI